MSQPRDADRSIQGIGYNAGIARWFSRYPHNLCTRRASYLGLAVVAPQKEPQQQIQSRREEQEQERCCFHDFTDRLVLAHLCDARPALSVSGAPGWLG
jgi:hypothetical protein